MFRLQRLVSLPAGSDDRSRSGLPTSTHKTGRRSACGWSLFRQEAMTDCALSVVRDALRLARETRWDSVRSPHVFMGLLSQPDHCVRDWGDRLKADLPKLLRISLIVSM